MFRPVRESLKYLKLALILRLRDIYNIVAASRPEPPVFPCDLEEFREIRERARKRTDISDHLITLFIETLIQKPRLIVELGTRGGDSTFVLERAAKLCRAKFISVDIEDCAQVSQYPDWIFVQKDDIRFAREFKSWCRTHGLEPAIDILFIDTSHEYNHTVQEIRSWFPWMAERGKVLLHDTNLKYYYFRKDRSMDIGWKNQRGVIRALEEYFGCRFDEKRNFTGIRKNWLIKHWPNCCGLTILEKWDRQ